MIELLIQNGAKIEAMLNGITALHYAVLIADLTSVKMLLKYGASEHINVPENLSFSPILLVTNVTNSFGQSMD